MADKDVALSEVHPELALFEVLPVDLHGSDAELGRCDVKDDHGVAVDVMSFRVDLQVAAEVLPEFAPQKSFVELSGDHWGHPDGRVAVVVKAEDEVSAFGVRTHPCDVLGDLEEALLIVEVGRGLVVERRGLCSYPLQFSELFRIYASVADRKFDHLVNH